MSAEEITYLKRFPSTITESELSKCSTLFSEHYGIWKKNQKRVRLFPTRIQTEYLFDKNCFCILAFSNEDLVGHAFAREFPYERTGGNNSLYLWSYMFSQKFLGSVVWVTQLVVHTNFRHRGIARTLLEKCFTTELKAAAIVTSHPYAVRAFEKAVNLQVKPDVILQSRLYDLIIASEIPYLQNRTLKVSKNESIICTDFEVDHTEINEILENEKNWKLGKVSDGEEFLAIVFRNDAEEQISTSYIKETLGFIIVGFLLIILSQNE